MNMDECPKESSVLAALANDAMDYELAAHLRWCAVCQEARLIRDYLRDFAHAEAGGEIAPAGIVWWRAQLEKKRADARRSIALIDIMQRVALAVAIVIVVGIGAWQGAKLFDVPRVLLAGSAAILFLFVVSVIVELSFARASRTRARIPCSRS